MPSTLRRAGFGFLVDGVQKEINFTIRLRYNFRVAIGVLILLMGLMPGLFPAQRETANLHTPAFTSSANKSLQANPNIIFPELDLRHITSGLTKPTVVTNAGDGSNRLFIAEQTGHIRILVNGTIVPTPFLDISDLVGGGEAGLLGVAFHPDYASNGFFYVDYVNGKAETVVARYNVSAGDPNVADPASSYTILTQQQPGTGHNGGQLGFGPDGYLYIAFGDGGCCGDPNGNGQNLETWLGKLLRVDVNRDDFPGDPNRNYGLPSDNPFIGGSGLDEIWAYGLRNSWRFSFDRLTGDLFLADVGETNWEEINFQPAISAGGENYGWSVLEGRHCLHDMPRGTCNAFLNGKSTLPILEYNHSFGCSVIGGYRYRGESHPELQGIYLYGDYCSGRIWGALPRNDGTWQSEELLATGFNITTFGQDEAGELYVVDYNGDQSALYEIVSRRTAPRPRPSPAPRPTR